MAPAQKHRKRLVETSLTLFRRQGYAATGLAEILEASGSPKGSFYHYFPEGKEAIAEASLRVAAGWVEALIRQLGRDTSDPGAAMLAYGERMAQALESSGFRDGCPVATLMLEAAPQSERLTCAGRDAFALWTAAIADGLILEGVAAERARSLAEFSIAAVEGGMLLARVKRSAAPLRLACEEICRLFREAIQSKKDQ